MLSGGKANIFSSETAINCSPLSFWKCPNTVKSHIGSEGTSQSWNLPPAESMFATEVQKTDGVEFWGAPWWCYMKDRVGHWETHTHSYRQYTTFELKLGKSGNAVSAWTVFRETYNVREAQCVLSAIINTRFLVKTL